MSLLFLVLAYLLGGLTFPLILLVWSTKRPKTKDTTRHIKTADPPTAAGYFAVCREYVPAGINGKPPERSTPAGDVQVEGNSVYQSMYKVLARPDVKARNIFYVALRHDHLLLFDSAEQLEVRHVISLLHHNVDLYAGGQEMTEGDLFIRRNCIRLTREDSQPFYLFSVNCSDKEDFYHALLAAKNALPMHFDSSDMLKLVQTLHTSDADPHLKWLNALMGRLFLSVYKMDQVREMVKTKIACKIDRVPKPAFVSSVSIQDIDIGDAAPTFSNFKLKELNVDEDVILEADVKYNGGFRLQIASTVRIDLGQRIRARQVNLLLAVVLKRLAGHIQIKVKSPPSNRLWVAFEAMPQVDLSIEPIVSSRQITYGPILRAIENRIREVLAETIVLPNWDDIPFMHTELRGGIWHPEPQSHPDPIPSSHSDTALPDRSPTLLSPTAVSSSVSLPSQVPSLIRSTRSSSFASAATPVVSTDVQPAIDMIKDVKARDDKARDLKSPEHKPRDEDSQSGTSRTSTVSAVSAKSKTSVTNDEASSSLASEKPGTQTRWNKPSMPASFAKTFAQMRATPSPMGRGQPLPPIGAPLPGPQRGWAALGNLKKKTVGGVVKPPPLPTRPPRVDGESVDVEVGAGPDDEAVAVAVVADAVESGGDGFDAAESDTASIDATHVMTNVRD